VELTCTCGYSMLERGERRQNSKANLPDIEEGITEKFSKDIKTYLKNNFRENIETANKITQSNR